MKGSNLSATVILLGSIVNSIGESPAPCIPKIINLYIYFNSSTMEKVSPKEKFKLFNFSKYCITDQNQIDEFTKSEHGSVKINSQIEEYKMAIIQIYEKKCGWQPDTVYIDKDCELYESSRYGIWKSNSKFAKALYLMIPINDRVRVLTSPKCSIQVEKE